MVAAASASAAAAYDVQALAAPRLEEPVIDIVAHLLANRGWLGRCYASILVRRNGFHRLATVDAADLAKKGFTPDMGRAVSNEAEAPEDFPPAPAAQAAAPPAGEPGVDRPVCCADYEDAYRKGLSPMKVCNWLLRDDNLVDVGCRKLNAVVRTDPFDIQRQFQASAQRWEAGKPLSPIDGVPFVVKDELHAAGYIGTCGCNAIEEYAEPALEDSVVVANLKAAGAVLIGKTHMTELGMAMNGYNPTHRQCFNPYDVRREPAGSSSGSGAAVGCGLVPFAIGCDGGGSIRMPAARCAAVGLKPTKGLVTNKGRVLETTTTLGHVGPIGATAQDANLMLHYMSARRSSGDVPRPIATPDVSKLRIGVFWPWFRDADARVLAICEEALSKLKRLGATVCDVEIPHLNRAARSHSAIILHESRGAMSNLLGQRGFEAAVMTQLGYEVRMKFLVSEAIDKLTSNDGRNQPVVETAFACRAELSKCFADLLENVDVIATPAMPTLPAFHAKGGPKLDVTEDSKCMRYMLPANLTGLPAVTVNVGFLPTGDTCRVPVGFQFMGNNGHERRLLQLARFFEGAAGGVAWRAPQVHVAPPV